jgi:hypothetical protein
MSHYSRRKSQVKIVAVMILVWSIDAILFYPKLKEESISLLPTHKLEISHNPNTTFNLDNSQLPTTNVHSLKNSVD